MSTARPRPHRRDVLTGGLSLLGGLALAPALARAAARREDRRNLVLLQLSGGNDGLSTVVPWEHDAYAAARRATRLRRKDVLPLGPGAEGRGLHGGLRHVGREWKEGRLAIVEGVGYPDMLRSHFMALEVWHTADRAGRAAGEGWVGRLAGAAWAEQDHPELVVHLGRNVPWSVHSSAYPAAALESPTSYKWFGAQPEAELYCAAGGELEAEARGRAREARHSGRDAALARLRGVLDDARDSSLSVRRATAAYEPSVEYPGSLLGATLRDVAAMIHGGLGTRVFSTSVSGFDTHAGQRNAHDTLMGLLDGALGAFLADLTASERGRETLVLVFSEFGRRVEENASGGTDHGKAGPMLVLGPAVRGGLYGQPPSLTELDDGDLAWSTDFRSVYGSVIEGWFGVPMERVLGERYPLLPFVG